MEQTANLLTRFGAAEFPLRPLLYVFGGAVFGGAVTAAGVYYYVRNRGDEERTAEDSSPDPDWMGGGAVGGGAVDGGAVDGGAVDGGAVDGGAVDGVTPTGSAARAEISEAERKCEQEKSSNAQAEREKLVLMEKVITLQDSMLGLNNQLLMGNMYSKAMEVMTQQFEEVRRKDETLTEMISKLESDLQTKQAAVSRLEKELAETQRRCDKATRDCEQKDQDMLKLQSEFDIVTSELISECEDRDQGFNDLKNEYNQAKEIFVQECEQKDNELRELKSKYNKMKETLLQLRERVQTLETLSNTILQDYMRDCTLKAQYEEMKQQHEELVKEYEQEREAHRILKLQYDQMEETGSQNEESQRDPGSRTPVLP